MIIESQFSLQTPNLIMIMNTAVEEKVLFDVKSFLKAKSIKEIKDIFIHTPLDPQQEDILKIVPNRDLDDLIRLQSEELNDQDISVSLRRMKELREKATISSVLVTWKIFRHLALHVNDIIFEEFLVRGLPLWQEDNIKRRMHSIMRYVFYVLYRRSMKGKCTVTFVNFTLFTNEAYLYNVASSLIKNQKFRNQKKKSEKLQNTLLGNSGIKNMKKLQNLKKNNIFFLYDKVDLNVTVKDNYFVNLLAELISYNTLNDSVNKTIADFKSLRDLLSNVRLDRQGGLLDSDHRLSADINVKLPEFEINGLPEMLGMSGKPFVRASYPDLKSKFNEDSLISNLVKDCDESSENSYHTSKLFTTPSTLDSIFSWFKGFNYDHAILLVLGLNLIIAKLAKNADTTLRKTMLIILMAGSYYIMFLNMKKLFDLAGEFPNLSNDTCDYFFNSLIYSSIVKVVTYVTELYTGKGIPPIVVNEDWDIHMDDLPGNSSNIEEVYEQSSFGGENVMKIAATAFLAYVSTSHKMKIKPEAADLFLAFLNTREYAISNLMTLLTSSIQFVQDIFNFIFNTEVNFVSFFDINKYTSEEAKNFCEKISNKLVGFQTGAKEVDTFSHEIFIEDVCEGNKLLKKLERSSYDYQRITTLLREYEKLSIQNKVTMKALSGSRVEPVGLLLRGPPGTKKTIVLNRLARMVSRFTLPTMWKKEWEENPDGFIYNIPNDKFWDGYTYKAWVSVSDDLFQQRDVAGDADSEALKVIKMINCNPYVLQMADVSMKNTKFFRSAFVMATSNLMDFSKLEAIRDYKAVSRRFHVTLDVSVNPKYADRACEYDNYLELEGKNVPTSLLPNDYWIFKFGDRTVSMSEVVKTLVSFHKNHVCDYISNIKSTYDAVKEIENSEDYDEDSFGSMFMETMNDPNSLFNKIRDANNSLTRQSSGEGIDISYLPVLGSKEKLTLSSYRKCNPEEAPKFTSDYCKTSSRVQMLTFFIKIRHDLYNDRLGDALASMRSEHIMDFLERIKIKSNELSDFSMFNKVGWKVSVPQLDMMVYMKGEEIFIDQKFLARHYLFQMEYELENVQEERTSILSFMDSCWKSFKSILNDLFVLVKANFVNILIFSVAGMAVLKIAQGILKCFYPDSSLCQIDLETLERQDDSPERCHAKAKRKDKPKHIKKGDMLRGSDRVNWEGKPDSRRGVRIKTRKRHGLSLDGFDTSILAKISTDDIDVMNCSDVVAKVLNKYYFIIYVRDVKTDTFKKVGQSLNLVGNIFIMPHHFIDSIDGHTYENPEDFEIIMVTVNKRLIYRFPIDEFLDSGYATPGSLDKDLVYMVLTNTQLNSSGAIKYIAESDDFDRIASRKLLPTSLVGVSLSQGGNTVTCKKIESVLDTTSYYVKSDSVNEPGYVISNTLSYTSNSQKGDCGSLLVNECKTATGKCIIGLHVAGYCEKGVSATLNATEINKDLKNIGLDGYYVLEDEDFNTLGKHTPISVESQSGVHHTSVVPPTLSAPLPFKTDLVKSKFFGELPAPYDKPETLPAKLKPFFDSGGNYVDPYSNGLLNYGKDQVCISSKVCASAANDYLEQIFTSTASYSYDRKEPISLKEALHSFRNVGPIMSSTSPGWPLSLDKNNVKKRYYSLNSTNEERENAFLEIEAEVNRLLDMYANGRRPAFVYTDCLKDEKVSIEKCYLGKTRIFSACPFYLLVLFRMYFGAFMDAFINSNLDVGSAIGLNPYGPNWGYLVHKLKVHGKDEDGSIYVGAGDYSKFDGHEQPYLLNLIYRIISDWYGYKNFHATAMRKFLWAEITNSRHIHGRNIYEWFASMPSGNPLTSLINTMYNNLAFRIAWIFAGNEIADFQDNVYIAAMGDDNIFSVSQKFRKNFNELVMPELMRKVGMVYTTELKATATVAFRPIQEVEFLKRSFKYDIYKRIWIAPLRFSAVIEILNWTKKGQKCDEIAIDNVGLVLREISLHGKIEYDSWFSTLDDLLKTHYRGCLPKGIYSSDHATVYSEVLRTDNFKY